MAEQPLVPITRLHAINVLLQTAGQRPVSSLNVTGQADIAIAEAILDSTSREVQSEGWDFNTDHDLSLAREVDGRIPVPADALSIEPHYDYIRAVDRNGYLWNLEKHTYVWDAALKANVIRFFAFESIPANARWYITVRAARKFQRRVVGDEATEHFTAEEEVTARTMMTKADSATANRSMLNDPALRRIVGTNRRRRY